MGEVSVPEVLLARMVAPSAKMLILTGSSQMRPCFSKPLMC